MPTRTRPSTRSRIAPVTMDGRGLVLLDQRVLPRTERHVRCRTVPEVVRAIKNMTVRGAPAIGVTAAYGMVLSARAARARDKAALLARLHEDGRTLKAARPTAVNLAWAVDRMTRRAMAIDGASAAAVVRALEQEARAIHAEDVRANEAMGALGAALLPDEGTVLTHCNAGALATAGYGTALGVIRAAHARGKRIDVLADETRPFLQGARLTAWELHKDGIEVALIADGAAGHMMAKGRIRAVIVGADRIAMNGDVANKIGTYTVACLAQRHGIPFYVAAPVSTIDPRLQSGADIPIEERPQDEVLSLFGRRVAPRGVTAHNPAFDVTPAALVTAIITEQAVLSPPFDVSLRTLRFEHGPC